MTSANAAKIHQYDRVAFIKGGRVVHSLTLKDAAACVEVEMRVAPVDERLVAGLRRFGSGIVPAGDVIRMRVGGDQVLPEIVCWLVGRQARVYSIRSRRKSLEEWFVEVMGEDQRPG